MSLFENDEFRWRETYFVLLDADRCPPSKTIQDTLADLDSKYELVNVRQDEDGGFESLTLLSPDDYAAMDISFLAGEEISEAAAELGEQMQGSDLDAEQHEQIKRISKLDARFDIYHFEQVVYDASDEEDEYLDPGALLIVLDQLAALCDGIVVDPQTSTLL